MLPMIAYNPILSIVTPNVDQHSPHIDMHDITSSTTSPSTNSVPSTVLASISESSTKLPKSSPTTNTQSKPETLSCFNSP